MNNIVFEYITVFSLSFLLVFSLTPFIIKIAYKLQFLDSPNQRKVHKKATPLLGGLAYFSGFLILTVYDILLIPSRSFDLSIIGYLSGALLIVCIGMIDDRYGMTPKVKFIGQTLACLIFLYTNSLFYLLGNPYLSIAIQLLWMTTIINAMNFLDNLDGIICGMSGIIALGFYSLSFVSKTNALSSQVHFISLLSLTFAGSVFGFLPHNFNKAKIFSGDTGSMFIGYFLSSTSLLIGRIAVLRAQNSLFYLVPVILLSFALFDITFVSITRHRDGRRITQGGKDHTTHRMQNIVGSVKVTALIVYLINSILVISSVLVFKSRSIVLLFITLGLFVAVYVFMGMKLNKIPISVSKNQLRNKE